MTSSAGEIVLPGGYTQTVVRIGDTVRRRPGGNAAFVRDLLGRLEAMGFGDVPRWLGSDERGREMFSFVAGDVPLCLGAFDDGTLVAAARFICRFHDATASLVEYGRVICHNDLSPCNFAFRNGVPVAIIDFDLAAPGERLFDLGYAAWTWLDLGNKDFSPHEQYRRLTLFAAAYDTDIVPSDLIAAALERQKLLAEGFFGPAPDATRRWAMLCGVETRKLAALGRAATSKLRPRRKGTNLPAGNALPPASPDGSGRRTWPDGCGTCSA